MDGKREGVSDTDLPSPGHTLQSFSMTPTGQWRASKDSESSIPLAHQGGNYLKDGWDGFLLCEAIRAAFSSSKVKLTWLVLPDSSQRNNSSLKKM